MKTDQHPEPSIQEEEMLEALNKHWWASGGSGLLF
jgi:hypothetical protein